MAQVIKKGSTEHNAHLESLKALAKAGDKDAAANLKQHEAVKPAEVKTEKTEK